MANDHPAKDQNRRITFEQLSLDDAGRLLSICESLTDEQLAIIAGGQRRICRIQTSSEGCGMNM